MRTPEAIAIGIAIGVLIGSVGMLIINSMWNTFAKKMNREWAEHCQNLITEFYGKKESE